MRFEVFTEGRTSEDTTYFKLKTGTSGVTLVAVDRNGSERSSGNILHVNASNGKLSRSQAVGRDLGLSLDSSRKINLTRESR